MEDLYSSLGHSSHFQSIFDYDKHVKEQVERLPAEIIACSKTRLPEVDPRHGTLLIHFFSVASANLPREDLPEAFFSNISMVLKLSTRESIQAARKQVADLARLLGEWCCATGHARSAIIPLRSTLEKFRSSTEEITPIHAVFVQMCLLSKCFFAAIPYLDQPIFEVNHKHTKCTPTDVLLYFYYGGMIYTGLKQLQKASEFYWICFTTPASAVNAIMVEAWKKYVLVMRIMGEKFNEFPKNMPPVLHRFVKQKDTAYVHFAENQSNDVSMKKIEENIAVYKKDENYGLVKQVLKALVRRRIQTLTQTYLTLSVSHIADQANITSPAEAEAKVLDMIEEGKIHASIDQKEGMVFFSDDPEEYNGSEMVDFINEKMSRIVDLSKKLRSLDDAMSCDQEYLMRLVGNVRSSSGIGGQLWGGRSSEVLDDM